MFSPILSLVMPFNASLFSLIPTVCLSTCKKESTKKSFKMGVSKFSYVFRYNTFFKGEKLAML